MSITRQIRRKADRKLAPEDRRWPRASQVSEVGKDGAIRVLRPTKGWLRTSAKRVLLRIEQARIMAAMQVAALGPVSTDVAVAAAGAATAIASALS